MDIQYYYCPDYKTYVADKYGTFYFIDENGCEVMDNKRFGPILIGEIYTEDITRETYESHLASAKNRS